jgi:hypothetical protein
MAVHVRMVLPKLRRPMGCRKRKVQEQGTVSLRFVVIPHHPNRLSRERVGAVRVIVGCNVLVSECGSVAGPTIVLVIYDVDLFP